MTIHARVWSWYLFAGMEEGIFPHANYTGRGCSAEKTGLAYVAYYARAQTLVFDVCVYEKEPRFCSVRTKILYRVLWERFLRSTLNYRCWFRGLSGGWAKRENQIMAPLALVAAPEVYGGNVFGSRTLWRRSAPRPAPYSEAQRASYLPWEDQILTRPLVQVLFSSGRHH